ncbi:hypothetical protein CIB84_006043 [Bambusicola thoracicus]|uniref:medium-chain acyl-CoA ligase n=1 Tax=Bambusicola thoracicus TaxID=9083 RepID=A0A2P4T1G9_BAMTH|nr:hypothetical protein CIB84_006043 [Bambusicola thoracicus]
MRCLLKALSTVSLHASLRRSRQLCSQSSSAQTLFSYELIKQQYRPEVPEYFNFASDVLDRWAEVEKEGKKTKNPALWWVDGDGQEVKWSFEELGVLSRKAANVLSGACSLQCGDRVLLLLPRIPEWWLLNVACMRTGTVPIPGTQQLTAKDILYRLQKSKAKGVITDDSVAPTVESVEADCQSLKFKVLVSEGHREGWLSFKDLLKNAPSDHRCVTTKSQHPVAIYFTSGTTGAPKMTEHSHCSYGIGLTVSGSCTFNSLRHCASAGEPINPEVMAEWKARTGLDIHECYGQTETIIDENGNILPPGKEGEIAIKVKPTRPLFLFTCYTVVKAFVVLTPNYVSHDPEKMMKDLQDHVKKATAPYKYPRKMEFVRELPKTISGKIRRNELRQKEWRRY